MGRVGPTLISASPVETTLRREPAQGCSSWVGMIAGGGRGRRPSHGCPSDEGKLLPLQLTAAVSCQQAGKAGLGHASQARRVPSTDPPHLAGWLASTPGRRSTALPPRLLAADILRGVRSSTRAVRQPCAFGRPCCPSGMVYKLLIGCHPGDALPRGDWLARPQGRGQPH